MYVCMCVCVYVWCFLRLEGLVMVVNVVLRLCVYVCRCAYVYACMCDVSSVLKAGKCCEGVIACLSVFVQVCMCVCVYAWCILAYSVCNC